MSERSQLTTFNAVLLTQSTRPARTIRRICSTASASARTRVCPLIIREAAETTRIEVDSQLSSFYSSHRPSNSGSEMPARPEVSRNPDPDRRHDAEQLLAFVNEVVVPKNADADRARQIAQLGFGAFDSLHLASAERGCADVFLTTDDALLRRARRNVGLLHVRVENPVSWYEEVRL